MTEQEYIQQRLQAQIEWYNSKSTLNKNFYQTLKTIEIVISVLIPFLTGYLDAHYLIKYVIAILGLLIAIVAGIVILFKFQEKWIEYRSTAESLKHELWLFSAQSGPYKTDPTLPNLAERVEYLISKENSNWMQVVNKKEESKKQDAVVTE